MSGDKRARLKRWLEKEGARLHPLSLSQRELWETSAVPIEDPANHICCLIHVRGLVTAGDCEAALRRVVERQEVLRLSFLPGKEQPLQMIRKSSDPNVQFRDLSAAQAQPEAVEEIAQEIFHQPFDLLQGPLYRAVILRRAPDDQVFVFTIHHAIADGWTLGVFVHDLFGAYVQGMMGMPEPLPPVPLSYTAWDAAERAFWQPSELQPRAAFWKSALDGTRRLWTAPGAPAKLCRSVSYIPAELAAATRELARRNGATLFSTLLTTFYVTLSQWTGRDDIVVGTPVANRGKKAVRETMGYCSGVVPLRVNVQREARFLERLRAVHQTTVDCFANAMPFVDLTRVLGEQPAPGYHPVFQVRFALQNHPIPDVSLPTLSARLQMCSTGTARFDLGCEITEKDDALEVVWLFRRTMFSPMDMQNLDHMFQSVLISVCQAAKSPTDALTNSLP